MKQSTQEQIYREMDSQELFALIGNIHNAKDIISTSAMINEYFQKFGVCLMSIKFCDSADDGKAIRPYSGYPDGFVKVARQLQAVGGCPFSQEAMKRMQAFDASSIDRTAYDTFSGRRFFQEFDKLEHKHIAIVPVMVGRAVALFTFGLGPKPFKGQLRETVTETVVQIVPSFITRFPEIKTMFEQKHLSDLEQRMLTLKCEGYNSADMVRELGLSEFTIEHLAQNAAKKLQANNMEQLVYKAVALGEIPTQSSFDSINPARISAN